MSSKFKWLLVIILILTMTFAMADYKPTNRETKLPPKAMTIATVKTDDFEEIFDTEHFTYYFKDDRDVLAVYDKRNGYTWKTGLDIAFSKDIKPALRAGDPLGFEPIEEKMNTTFTGIANSLITIEYYDDSLGIKRLSSAAYEGASSRLMEVEGEPGHYVLDIAFEEMDIQLKAHLYFSEVGYEVKVYHEELAGEDLDRLAAILLSPFFGASGGMHALYDEEAGEHGDPVPKDAPPGYIFVPDGAGALIRFQDYNTSLKSYQSKVYGENLSKSTYHMSFETDSFVPFKAPLMPVYGVAHGHDQAAFLGYAKEGDAHMELVVTPEENTTLYTFGHPRFVYNAQYYQVFNKRGEGYFTLYDQPDEFDISFSYEFLAHEEADYVGMAKAYRSHLIQEGILREKTSSYHQLPLRVDFVMSDQKKSVIGYEDVVVTRAEDVQDILQVLYDQGIQNINSGLLGWQEGGISSGKPWKSDWDYSIGRKGDFEDLIDQSKELGLDVSFMQNYSMIHEDQMRVQGSAAKHLSNWYVTRELWTDVPFIEFYMAKPQKSAAWLTEQVKELREVGITSHSITGISSTLLSEHGKDPLTEEETIGLYQESLMALEDLTLSLETPNQYLWSTTDRFLQAPVYPTQYLIETDTVPFLQMVLQGTMEVYGPYSNFSFSSEKDVLRMIDYNMSPSFVVTQEPSYLLATTNSLNYYSTSFDQYQDLIPKIYEPLNEALSQVINARWIDRQVLMNGVIVNTYDNGKKIYINYRDEAVTLEDISLAPLSYWVE